MHREKKTDSDAESGRAQRFTFFLGAHAEVVAESIDDLAIYICFLFRP